MKIRFVFFALLISLNVLGQLSKTIPFTYDEGKSKMLKENVRLMAEYYNLDIAEAEIQQKRLWDNPLFVWNAEMYSIAENNYFNFANQKLLQLEYSFSFSLMSLSIVCFSAFNRTSSLSELTPSLLPKVYCSINLSY